MIALTVTEPLRAEHRQLVPHIAELARTVAEPVVDVSYVFYACEEVDARFNGVNRLFATRPDLL